MEEKKITPGNQKKQIPLRISAELYNGLNAWAENEFRSVNGQIEYLLTECVKHRRKKEKNDRKEEKTTLFYHFFEVEVLQKKFIIDMIKVYENF